MTLPSRTEGIGNRICANFNCGKPAVVKETMKVGARYFCKECAAMRKASRKRFINVAKTKGDSKV